MILDETINVSQLMLLLHHSGSTEPPDDSGTTEIWREQLITVGLLQLDPTRSQLSDKGCVLTKRGEIFIGMILCTPLPIQAWVDPRTIPPFSEEVA